MVTVFKHDYSICIVVCICIGLVCLQEHVNVVLEYPERNASTFENMII